MRVKAIIYNIAEVGLCRTSSLLISLISKSINNLDVHGHDFSFYSQGYAFGCFPVPFQQKISVVLSREKITPSSFRSGAHLQVHETNTRKANSKGEQAAAPRQVQVLHCENRAGFSFFKLVKRKKEGQKRGGKGNRVGRILRVTAILTFPVICT